MTVLASWELQSLKINWNASIVGAFWSSSLYNRDNPEGAAYENITWPLARLHQTLFGPLSLIERGPDVPKPLVKMIMRQFLYNSGGLLATQSNANKGKKGTSWNIPPVIWLKWTFSHILIHYFVDFLHHTFAHFSLRWRPSEQKTNWANPDNLIETYWAFGGQSLLVAFLG